MRSTGTGNRLPVVLLPAVEQRAHAVQLDALGRASFGLLKPGEVETPRRFVGRDREIAQLRAAVATPGVLCVHGPGGVGKSALLDMLADVAELHRNDRATVTAMTASRVAGREQAALASYWMDHRPEAFRVFHVASGAPSGCAARLDLRERDAGVDRGVDTMLQYRHGTDSRPPTRCASSSSRLRPRRGPT